MQLSVYIAMDGPSFTKILDMKKRSKNRISSHWRTSSDHPPNATIPASLGGAVASITAQAAGALPRAKIRPLGLGLALTAEIGHPIHHPILNHGEMGALDGQGRSRHPKKKGTPLLTSQSSIFEPPP